MEKEESHRNTSCREELGDTFFWKISVYKIQKDCRNFLQKKERELRHLKLICF